MIEYDVDYAYFEENDILDELEDLFLNDESGVHEPIAYVRKGKAPSDTSDGWHTFDELYEHRTGLLAALCNMTHVLLAIEGIRSDADVGAYLFKSRRHHDGEMYDGMFIVGINCNCDSDKPALWATWHCEDEWWDKFAIPELDRAPEWDGHTPKDALERLVHAFTPEEDA